MDSPDAGTLPPSPESKQAVIAAITQQDRSAFYEWAREPTHQRNFGMPIPALRYMFIPQRVLEISSNPSAIDLRVYESTNTAVESLVVEQRNKPVTDALARRKYLEDKEAFWIEERAKKGNPKFFPFPKTGGPSLPENVDVYHTDIRYSKLVESGIFDLNDYFINNMRLLIRPSNNRVIFVGDIRFRDSLQRAGAGTAVYKRLEECARILGFRYITGVHWEKNNIIFFRDKLGFSTLDQIKPEARKQFSDTEIDAQEFSIDFLYPEDKAIYLK